MLTLDDIYHPKIAKIYLASQCLSFILTTSVIFPAIYIVLTKSRKATSFKYLLIYQLVTCYAFCVHLFLDSYVPLFPLPAFYSVSFFGVPENISIILHLFLSLAATNSYILTVFYRMTYASAFSRFQPLFEDTRKMVAVMFGSLFITCGVIVSKLFVQIINQYIRVHSLSLPPPCYQKFIA
jgi:hypothetical protein